MNGLLQRTQGLSQFSLTPLFQTPLCFTPSPIQIQSLATASLAFAPATATAFLLPLTSTLPTPTPARFTGTSFVYRTPAHLSGYRSAVTCSLQPPCHMQAVSCPSSVLPHTYLLTEGNKHKCQALCFKVLLTIVTLNSHRSPIM